MPYCSQCGVEVDAYVDTCPLCLTPIKSGKQTASKVKSKFPDKPAIEKKAQVMRFLAWEIISVSLLTALFIVFLTNFLVGFNVTWAWYPMASICLAWLLASFPLLLKRPLVISILSAASITAFLAFIDLIDNLAFDWYYYIALPILLLVIVVTTPTVLLCAKVKKKGFNIAAFILFATGIIVSGLDVIINYALEKTIALTWSPFVIIPVLFTGLFFLYIHYRLLKAGDIRKWFQT